MLGTITCPHIISIDEVRFQQRFSEEVEHRNRIHMECHVCGRTGQYLWICLNSDCFKVFCSDGAINHVFYHYKRDTTHCLHMNLSNYRIWCHECSCEIKFEKESSNKEETTKGLVGLQNLGNTCYMNAALQSLANIPPLVDYFLNCSLVSGPKPQVTRAFHRLIVDIWSKSGGYIAPQTLLFAIRHCHPMYRGFQQHDSQEFLRCLLDHIHEEMKVPCLEPLRLETYLCEREGISDTENGSSGTEDYETCDSGVSEQSSQGDEIGGKMTINRSPSFTDKPYWKQHFHSSGTPMRTRRQVTYRSIISDVFNGTLLSSVQCLTCNRVSSRVETFQDLSLPIPNRDTMYILHQSSVSAVPTRCSHLYSPDQSWLSWLWDCVCNWIWGPQVSLHDCLSAFFSADELKGDNMYSCEKCQKLRNGVKYSRLMTCPEVLCVHLKRFRHEPALPSKISTHVSFPLNGLDLSPYMVKDSKIGVTKYDLVSVICHHGHGGSSGHYTCLAKNRTTGQWYEYDDHCVSPISNVSCAKAYILFYRKENVKVNRARKRASKLEESSSSEKERYYISRDWLVKFNSFSEPGPVDNRLLLCQHNCIFPGVETVIVSGTVWKYLITRFGGGPDCPADVLNVCDICSELSGGDSDLLRVQLHEFHRLQTIGMHEKHPISLYWLSNWDNYVKGRTAVPPGPVITTGITCDVSLGRWELLTSLYGIIQQSADSSESDSRSLDERISLDNLDSGIWVQNRKGKGTSSDNFSIEISQQTD